MRKGYSKHLLTVLILLPIFSVHSALAQNTAPQESNLQARPARKAAPIVLTPIVPLADQSLRIKRAPAAATSATKPAAGAPTAAVAAPKPVAKGSALDRGKYFSRHGAYSDALNFFTRAADAEPKNPEPYNRRARVEWQLEKNDEALEDVRYAIKLNPDYAEAFCTRAAILNSTGHYHDAIVDAALAIELKPKLREAYTIQASAYRNLKQYREADDLLAKLESMSDSVSAFDEWAPKIDYTQYISDLQSSIRQHWQGPQGNYPSIVVLFKLHRTGQITDVRVNSAGVATADNAAIEAAKSAAPFQQPPAGSPPDFDVFVVLDPPPLQSVAEVDGAPASTPAPTPVPASPARKLSGINWGGTINTGLNLMRFIPLR